jgi:uncharacterized protein YabN with tetrapyrrole methylase and pyrophosphatase domain
MKLTIVGSGIRRPHQLTLETVHALQSSRRVLHLTATPQATEAALTALGVTNSRGLDELYAFGAVDDENYRRLLDSVKHELTTHETVSLMLYGHPRVGVTLTAMLEASLSDIASVVVLPATSSFDTMINDLRRDPLARGSVLIDANRLLLFDAQLNPSLDHYVFHAGSVATRKTLQPGREHGDLELLKNHLLRFYPADHKVKVVASSVLQDDGGIHEVELGQLERGSRGLAEGATLFVPALPPQRVNKEVRDRLRGTAC